MSTQDPRYTIHVSAVAQYVEAQSDPAANRYVFAYTITIENVGTVAAQLLNRHWVITDASGRAQEVRGEGVIGEQPLLEPGAAFRYTSSAMIATPVGSMHGEYGMLAADGQHFDAPIPPFTLSMPRVLH